MIKVVAVFALLAVMGGALYYWVIGPFLLPMVSSATPQLGSLFVNAQEQIQNIIPFIQKNWQLVTATAGSVTVIGGYAANWLHKRGLEKQKVEATLRENEVQKDLFTVQGENYTLQDSLTQAKTKINTLESNAQSVAEITGQLTAKTREVEKLTAERNQLAQLLPNIKSAEQLIKEAKQVP